MNPGVDMDKLNSKAKRPPTWREMNADTDPKIEEIQFKLLREMPTWRKLEIVGDMNKAMIDLARLGLEDRYPEATPNQIRRILADKILGKDLARKAYGPCDYPHHEEAVLGDS